MESSTEILRVAAAIVSTFQTAADMLETIKVRKEKKKRKKDKDVEELLELRILHKSLVEGERKVRKHCENRNRQYNPAFGAGDEIAIAALKDVVISLQSEVIQALNFARGVESSVLDFTSLHESSVTSCRDATRAMDQLCQRIMASIQFQPQHNVDTSGAPSNSSMRSGFASMGMGLSEAMEPYDLPPSPPASVGSPPQSFYQRALPPLPSVPHRASTVRGQSDMATQRERYYSPQSPHQEWPERRNVSHTYPVNEHQQTSRAPEYLDAERQSGFSIHSSAPESDRESVCTQVTQPASCTSKGRYFQDPASRDQTTYDHQQPPQQVLQQAPQQWVVEKQRSPQWNELPQQPNRQWSEKPQQTSQQWAAPSNEETALSPSEPPGQADRYTFGKLALPTPGAETSAFLSQTTRVPRIETDQEHIRAMEAPEVLNPSPRRQQPDLSSEKYPAFRTQADYEDLLKALPAGMDNIWKPLARPAMHNRYHGFCKGAWQTRKAVHEGLEVQITPSLKEPIIYWACKSCKFRSKAPNVDTLPDAILFNQKYNIRYRWLFLAKSHRETQDSFDTAETYKYGCMFCAAEGKATSVHEKLEHLLVHIIAKHKSTTMNPELKRQTKCIVGSVAKSTANWDIIVPESNQKGSPSVAADEFFISASKFFSRRKGKG